MGATIYLSEKDFQLIKEALTFTDIEAMDNKEDILAYDETQRAINRLLKKYYKALSRKSVRAIINEKNNKKLQTDRRKRCTLPSNENCFYQMPCENCSWYLAPTTEP